MKNRLTIYVALLAMLPLVAYVVGYFSIGGRRDYPPFPDGAKVLGRNYSYRWLVLIFKPAGMVESAVRQQPVSINLNYEGIDDAIVRKHARPRP